MKVLIVLVLLLPLATVSTISPSAPDGSYRVDMKFRSTGSLPGEILATDSEPASRSHLGRTLDAVPTVSCSGLGDLDFFKNAYRVFHKTVPIHKLKAVFVIYTSLPPGALANIRKSANIKPRPFAGFCST